MKRSLLVTAVLLSCGAAVVILLGVHRPGNFAVASGPTEIRITTSGLVPEVTSVTVGAPVMWINETEAKVNIASGRLFRLYLPLVAAHPGDERRRLEAPSRVGADLDEAFGAVLEPGEEYTHTFRTPGCYPYHVVCAEPHLTLAGEVCVQDAPPPSPTPAPERFTYEVVREYPHDPAAFTQGLVFQDGYLYEGTGLYGASSLRKVDLETGEVLQIRELADEYFGEGIAIYEENKIAQLTWRSRIGFVYDREDFDLLQQFDYQTEGWGLTFDGARLIMSDGTSTLHFLDPDTLEEVSSVEVRDGDEPVQRLNELEYVKGAVYANVWLSDTVAVIDPSSGQVSGWIELQGLLSPEEAKEANVLNGIAYDAGDDRLFVTGKLWPKVFEIRLLPLLERLEYPR